MNAPGLGPSLSLFRHAREGQQGERAGIGALRMGLNAADPGLAAKLAQQSKDRREQDAAGGLEEAVTNKAAQVRGEAMPLINFDQSRRLGVAGMAGNQAGNSTGLWSQFRAQPSFWRTFTQSLGNSLGRSLGTFGVPQGGGAPPPFP